MACNHSEQEFLCAGLNMICDDGDTPVQLLQYWVSKKGQGRRMVFWAWDYDGS